jgi:hypothetical protein
MQERQAAGIRARLGEESYTAEWSIGKQMTTEQAVAFALGEKA